MANKLPTEHVGGQLGITRRSNIVKRALDLKTCFNCKYDYQRAECEV
jgi:hypothetical protein